MSDSVSSNSAPNDPAPTSAVPIETTIDARLVTAYVAGDRGALAGIYDRYANKLFDVAAAMMRDRHEAADVVQDTFVVAAERMAQLRDPEKLKPWLFAIARHEIYRRTKRRARSVPTDFNAAGGTEMAAAADPRAEASAVSLAELAELVRAAARGLDERDQLVLELSVRQGLQGADLAAALGITPEQSYTVVHRMRERVDRSLGALAVARAGRRDCPELAEVLRGWDGSFSILVRKRVARHVDSCDTCERTKRKVAPVALIGSAPALAAPPDLRERVLGKAAAGGGAMPLAGRYRFDEANGFPRLARGARRVGAIAGIAAAAIILVAGGVAIANLGDSERTTLRAATPPSAVAGDQLITADSVVETATTGPPAVTSTAASATSVAIVPTTSTSILVAAPGGATTAAGVAGAVSVAPTPPTPPVAVRPTAPTVPPPTRPPDTVAPATTLPPTTTTTPAPPGQLNVSVGSLDFGSAGTSDVVILSNSGGAPLTYSLSNTSANRFSVGGALSGSLDPGQSVPLTVNFDRGSAPENTYSNVVAISGAGSSHPLTLSARVEIAPTVGISPPATTIECQFFAPVAANATDTTGISGVTLSWTGPGGVSGATAMANQGGSTWGAMVSPGPAGIWNITATATDTRGNTASATSKFTVNTC